MSVPPDPAPLDPVETVELPQLAPEPGSEVQLPLVRVELTGAQVNIAQAPDGSGDRALVVGPVLFQIILPLDAANARAVGRELTGGIEIASAIPPASRIVRR